MCDSSTSKIQQTSPTHPLPLALSLFLGPEMWTLRIPMQEDKEVKEDDDEEERELFWSCILAFLFSASESCSQDLKDKILKIGLAPIV